MTTKAKRGRRPATKPWEPSESPWKRDMLRLKFKRPGWRPRFVAPRNIERNLADGWTFADIANYGGVHDQLVGETGQIDTKIRRRELVLMEIPEEKALQRDQHYANVAKRTEEGITKRFKKETTSVGASHYAPRVGPDDRPDAADKD